ncbi:xanthine dehydrogenase family protein subunit M [Halanaerobium sp. MA284_MarDTE_T2]|nr:xanthine dehydrogenase family protein subunit M [Halanaerobium sp. MA284_MarDTE_T2]RCW50692.1 carbon-monoxide dehydrogenase medium subunit/xanthine dehydrogenase FAD-binding subunit [Halanaerobium sp. MA284_MarDTE_T2]RCW86860.1 carbon-monoxide dehydrogenase medium subunit/xanthine dehydrogenase FAD-binding subunit [Halanaerobium sp. DL-01]
MKQENNQPISGTDFKNYFQPSSLKEALEIRDKYRSEVKLVAGATDIFVQYNEKLHEVENWLDISRIEDLKKIEKKEKSIFIGPLVTHLEIIKSDLINKHFSALSAAALEVGSPQIRSRGTIGGNICTSSPAGDLLPPLLAYEAKFHLSSRKKSRIVESDEFFTGPKKNILKDSELLTGIEIPISDAEVYSFWKKIGRRKALVISTLTLNLVLEFENDLIKRAGLAVGSAAPVPVRLKKIEEKMLGKKLSQLDYKKIAEEVKNRISPIDDLRGTKEYREDVAADIMVNALEKIEKERVSG